MAEEHAKIIAAAAKATLGPMGFKRRGQTRLWILDHGIWLNIVGFRPGQWSVSVDLDNAVHWLWAGHGFMSLDYLVRGSHTSFEDKDQFRAAVAQIADQAASSAKQLENQFSSFGAIAGFVIQSAKDSEDMRRSWFGYKAGLACGLLGRLKEAEHFLSGITDPRVVHHATPLLALVNDPRGFRSRVNGIVAQQRAALKLPVLECDPF
ncbi:MULTISPECIES: hypothetical protein [unclassified Sphingomonas]|uniref:hypothetical protein n=1 Tax=unclassified Sphingomonas TaxID=196159 RepID=UPI0012E36902|nr:MULTISPECIES: hypothetical protein [unclassified Sphingomonas]